MNPYWAHRLNELSHDPDIHLVCWFTKARGSDREWVTQRDRIPVESKFLPTSLLPRIRFIVHEFFKLKPTNIFTFYFDPLHWLLLLPARLTRSELAFYVEKTFDTQFKRTFVKETIKRVVLRAASTVFVPGHDAEHYVRKYDPRSQIRLLEHAVDLKMFEISRYSRQPSNHVRFLYLGRLVKDKGIDTLLQAFQRASADCKMSLTIVGSGAMRPVIETWASTISSPATLIPFVQAEDLGPIFAQTDVLVFPTFADTYGLVVNEAMASGMPVISSTMAGEISTRLIDGSDQPRGMLFEAGSVDSLASTLLLFARSPVDVANMGQTAFQYAQDHFDLADWVESIHNWLFKDMAGLESRSV